MCGALYLQHALGYFLFCLIPAGSCRAKQMAGAVVAKSFWWLQLDPSGANFCGKASQSSV